MKILEDTILTDIEQGIIKTLLYFDIFNYPLTLRELIIFHPSKIQDENSFEENLLTLVSQALVFQIDNFYCLQNNPMVVVRRKKGNFLAADAMMLAKKQAHVISCFPYVRAVMVSGSLSKGYMDEESDLDFFLVTAHGKLWVSRLLLVMYKRIFLRNSHKLFCINYYVDDRHLEIEEHNLFTAIETVTVVPLINVELYSKFQHANKWTQSFLPNFISDHHFEPGKSLLMQKALELFVWPVSGLLQKVGKYLTMRRWQKLYGKEYSREDFNLAFKTTEHASKNHPRNFQKKVLQMYQEKIENFNKKFGTNITV